MRPAIAFAVAALALNFDPPTSRALLRGPAPGAPGRIVGPLWASSKSAKRSGGGRRKRAAEPLWPGEETLSRFLCVSRSYPGVRCIHADPPVFEVDDFFTPEECAAYVDKAQERGACMGSPTLSAFTQTERTSTTWFLKYQDVPEFLRRIELLTGAGLSQFEEPQCVRYELSQKFTQHLDTLPKSMMTAEGSGGQRIATVIVYLNSCDLGGATMFHELGIKVQPKLGKALIFFPAEVDGTPDERTLHSGQPAFDTKWIAQTWIHEGHYVGAIPEGTSKDEARGPMDAFAAEGP